MTRNRATNPTRRTDQSGGRAGKPSREAIGRSRVGLTSKNHLAADPRCQPISRVQCRAAARQPRATAGDGRDPDPPPRTRRGRTRPGRVLGDKAYSSRAIRTYPRKRRIKATIPRGLFISLDQ
jgi:hypothetical protein